MDQLNAVLDFLFDVESWSTYVIYQIFVEEQNPTCVKKDAAPCMVMVFLLKEWFQLRIAPQWQQDTSKLAQPSRI